MKESSLKGSSTGARRLGLFLLCLAGTLLSRVSTSSIGSSRQLKVEWTPAKYLKSIRRDSELDGKVRSDPPSYLGICAVLLDQAAGHQVPTVKVREDMQVCSGRLGLTESLTRILISSWIAAHGRAHFGLKIDYQHSCGRFENTFIHSLLPPKPVPRSRYTSTEREEALMFCQNAIISRTSADREAIESVLSRQISMIGASLNAAEERAKKKGYIPSEGIFTALAHRQPDITAETAVIHIPCMDQWCNNIFVLPFHIYLTNIPRSVRTIDIIIPPELQGNYREHALDLIGTLRKFNPRTRIDFVEGYPFQAQVFSRFMKADYVFCGPGGGLSCLFPILSQSQESTTQFKILDPETAAFLSSMTSPTPIQNYEIIRSPPPQSFRFLQTQPEGFRHYAYSQPDPAGCHELRGRFGRWVQIDDPSSQQYNTPLLHHSGASDLQFRQQHPGQVRPSTTYAWQEILYPSCAVSPIPSRKAFCLAFRARGIHRVFFLGDSLTQQMGLSLWMLLRPEVDIPLEDEGYMKRTVQCSPDFEITIEFVRNDELLENDQAVSLPNQVKNCHHFCYAWKEAYAKDPRRTLMVVNIGAHLHSRDLFNLAIPRFVTEIDSLQRPNDIVMFRTLVPGHKNCGEPGLQPFEHFGQYATAVEHAGGKDTYNWNILSSYNDAISKMLDDRRKRSNKNIVRMELLDVFPMTVLRQDGHIADAYKVAKTRKTDCLHYSLPGPTDWWNHLLFNQIQSMSI